MAAIFSQTLNMSMTGSIVILLVILTRFILRRAPKVFSYALWSVVLFRLLCPVAFTAPISVLDVVEPEQRETSGNTSIVTYIPATVNTQADFIMVHPEEQPVQTETASEQKEQLHMTLMHAAALVWAAGTVGLILYSIVQFLRLRSKLIGVTQLKGNIYLVDHIDTAFVVGLLQPRIYLPSSVPANERYYILAHEQHHIRRGDHIIKLLAYLALCIHWFNPLVWMAFVLSGKDMEMSCDEAVIKRLGPDIRSDYSASLLRLATHKKILSAMPLAFGEGDTKGRVLNMAKWKKPRLWVSILCVMLCIAVLAACAVNPMFSNAPDITSEAETTGNSTDLAAFSDECTNILITGYTDETQAIPDMFLLLSIYPDFEKVIMATILKDTYVSLPDYQGHITGDNKFAVCYALGKTWGGTEGAVEMVNQCIRETFEINVDHNMELTGAQYIGLVDILREIKGEKVSPLASDLKDLSNQLLTMIEETDNSSNMEQIKQKLATAVWESCNLPYEGTYSGVEKTIAGEKVWVLVINEDTGVSQSEQADEKYMPTIHGSAIVTDTELVQYGALKMLLPSGFAVYNDSNIAVLTKDSVAVGGIQSWKYPEFQPSDMIDFKKEELGVPIGYMSGNSAYGDTEYEIFWDGNPEGLNEQHTFFIDGDTIYDVWYDENLVSDGIAEQFLKTVAINADPNPAYTSQELEALAR